ncbi:tyrosine-type recombinase/integrase [Candidatus Woesearchaeota archaeon]|nr:tyrosine-type recombinase/integrase [Candidatus Woesearchaeota archaeon]
MENIIYSMKREMLRRRLSRRTIESYIFCIKKFLSCVRKQPRKITKKDVKNYLDDLAERNKSGSTINVYLSAIRFLLEEVLHRNVNLNFRYSKRPGSLPTVLSKEEVKRLFDVIRNPKHKLMIELLYSAGMRVSELLNLRGRDFEIRIGHGWIRKGKGNKDRPFIIADRLKEELLIYIKENNLTPNDYLFSRNKFFPMHTRTIQEIVKKAAKNAKIMKHIHPHTLRHSFATHLIQDGYKIADVQPLLGHSRLDTTMVYVHLASAELLSVKSPFDNL